MSDLKGELWEADRGLRVTAVAAYFADALRKEKPLPGTPDLSELATCAEELAGSDSSLRDLATAVAQADRLSGEARTDAGTD
ncbi:hypothetical protein [Streptomyces sp. NPDC048436]|uniref:hypothetical protein n=1 Tax=Streptomyces sp. NPDC048436 TaxID=3365550 RepID=UPI0037225704